MTRATGGSAWAATSTRSRFLPHAYSRASSVALIPTCSPFSSINLTFGARIISLIRACGTGARSGSTVLRGLKDLSPSSRFLLFQQQDRCQAAARILVHLTRLNLREAQTAREVRVGPCLIRT